MSTEAVDRNDHASLPESTAEHLKQFGVEPELAAVVMTASGHRRLKSQMVPGNYVSVAPFQGGFIAGYIAQKEMSLALPPLQAKAVSAEHGWRLETASDITSYVHIPAAALVSAPARSTALQLLLESLDWRALGDGQGRNEGSRGAAPVTPAPMCPVHFTEMLGGCCDDCD